MRTCARPLVALLQPSPVNHSQINELALTNSDVKTRAFISVTFLNHNRQNLQLRSKLPWAQPDEAEDQGFNWLWCQFRSNRQSFQSTSRLGCLWFEVTTGTVPAWQVDGSKHPRLFYTPLRCLSDSFERITANSISMSPTVTPWVLLRVGHSP